MEPKALIGANASLAFSFKIRALLKRTGTATNTRRRFLLLLLLLKLAGPPGAVLKMKEGE